MKNGEFVVGKMRFHVPSEMVRCIDRTPARRKAELVDGSKTDLAKINGECIFQLDKIRVEQLGWLSLRRYVQYILVNEREKLVAVSVQ